MVLETVGSNPIFHPIDPLAQSAEHLTFNQGVPSSNLGWVTIYAGMAKLADALDLGSSAARRGGSSPLSRTIVKYADKYKSHCFVKTVTFIFIQAFAFDDVKTAY